MAEAVNGTKQGASRKSRPLTSALVSMRSRRNSAVQSLMYDEDGNRRRLFGGSVAGGMSSGGSASSQAHIAHDARPALCCVEGNRLPRRQLPTVAASALDAESRSVLIGSRSLQLQQRQLAACVCGCCGSPLLTR